MRAVLGIRMHSEPGEHTGASYRLAEVEMYVEGSFQLQAWLDPDGRLSSV